MADVSVYDEELATLEKALAEKLKELDSVTDGQLRVRYYDAAQDLVRRLNRTLQQFRMELRTMGADAAGQGYADKATEHMRRISELKKELQLRRIAAGPISSAAAAGRESVSDLQPLRSDSTMADKAATSPAEGPSQVWSPREVASDDGKQVARQTALRIQNVQQQTLHSLRTTEKLINETEVVGNEAATTLQAQTEQIRKTNEQLQDMHSELDRASSELKAFMRRMARDRIVIFFLIAILICIIVIVVLAVVKYKRHH